MEKEKCVICGVDTNYNISTNVDMRVGYIEGVGQLCLECYNKDTSDDETITISKKMVLDNPNDSILGSKIRRIFLSKS